MTPILMMKIQVPRYEFHLGCGNSPHIPCSVQCATLMNNHQELVDLLCFTLEMVMEQQSEGNLVWMKGIHKSGLFAPGFLGVMQIYRHSVCVYEKAVPHTWPKTAAD
jgi:hypothetical protein